MLKFNMAPTARRIVETAAAIRPEEKVLIVTDSERPISITEALAHAVSSAGGILAVVHMPPHKMGGVDPPAQVAAAMAASDVVILQTSFATVHTDAARRALKNGARIIEMWGWEENMMTEGGSMADYTEVRHYTEQVAGLIRKAARIRFTTPAGSDLSLSVEGRTCFMLTGTARERGSFTGFPEGEVALAPVEGSAEGVLVNPLSIEHRDLGILREPFGRIDVSSGKIVSMSGSRTAERFLAILEECGDSAKNIGEFAVGTNPACRPYASLREAKKTRGTCHVACGDSASLGGNVVSPLHVDVIFDQPTLYADGRMILQAGRIMV